MKNDTHGADFNPGSARVGHRHLACGASRRLACESLSGRQDARRPHGLEARATN
jgi:hypothetical protein